MPYLDTMYNLTDNVREPFKTGIRNVVNLHIELETEFKAEAAKIAGNGDLSPEGKAKAKHAHLKTHAHRIIRAEQFVERSMARLADREANLQLPAIDRADALGAAMAVAVCQRVFAMSPAERKAALAMASLPYLQAVLAAPDELSGLNAELRQAAITRAIGLAHPGKLEQINQDRESLRLMGSAVQALREVARQFVGLPNDAALTAAINTAVPDQRHIAADVERETAPLAA